MSKSKPHTDWRAFAHARGLKLTGQREAVLDAFAETDGHVGLEQILALARRRSPNIGPATIYRTMKLLEDAGLAERHEFGGRASVYERTDGRAHHDHLICQKCGAIQEFADTEIEALQAAIARAHGFTITAHRHEVYGLCKACAGGGANGGGTNIGTDNVRTDKE